ncbi:MAG: cob(I)yrinic acid a,c-diamide adenosyltransferase [candidate division WOR-3 bacterium]|nr:MAG: cob(I)yrinic acid a,c-diamide adenosyltransferase [candidate division WOR-3 bacterium]
MIHIYTGNGKGKTTAALGLAMRAVGHGLKVIMIQFMKGRIDYGELKSAGQLSNFTIEQYGRPDFVNPDNPDKEDIRLAQEAFARAREATMGSAYDIVILDELNVAVSYGLIKSRDVIELFERRPTKVTLILTGRQMPEEFVQYADLITECREIKHYFRDGIQAQKGIEY